MVADGTVPQHLILQMYRDVFLRSRRPVTGAHRTYGGEGGYLSKSALNAGQSGGGSASSPRSGFSAYLPLLFGQGNP